MGLVNVDGFELNTARDEEGIIISSCKGDGAGALTLPDEIEGLKIRAIAKKAFFAAGMLKEVSLPGSITSIGDWAFSRCHVLRSFCIRGDGLMGLPKFGQGVFDGDERLESIDMGLRDEDLKHILASLAVKLPAAYLLRDKDIGSISWYKRYDMALLSFLSRDDLDGAVNNVLCGEEDISYDGIGSVDGELPGEDAAYLRDVMRNKSRLALLRLMHHEHLTDRDTQTLKTYIREHGKGCDSEAAWESIREDFQDDVDAWSSYMEISRPDTETIKEMLYDLTADKAQLRAFLISYTAGERKEGGDIFDELML